MNKLLPLLPVVVFSSVLAQADPLEIEAGSVSTISNAYITQDSVSYTFSGPGFTARGYTETTFVPRSTIFPITFDGGWIFPIEIQAEGFGSCSPRSKIESCGSLQLFYDPFPVVVDPETYKITAPFTAIGKLNVGEGCNPDRIKPQCPGIPITGYGSMTVTYSKVLGHYYPQARFAFEGHSVPEPSTLVSCTAFVLLLATKKLLTKTKPPSSIKG